MASIDRLWEESNSLENYSIDTVLNELRFKFDMWAVGYFDYPSITKTIYVVVVSINESIYC